MNILSRNIESKDVEELYKWRTDPIVQDSSLTEVTSMEEHVTWFNSCDTSGIFIVEVEGNKIGTFNLLNNSRHNRLTWSFYLNPQYKGLQYQGIKYSNILCKEALRIAFEELNSDKIIGEVLQDNVKSVILHKKLGFTQEGYFKKHIIKYGKRIDLYQFGLLKEEYNK